MYGIHDCQFVSLFPGNFIKVFQSLSKYRILEYRTYFRREVQSSMTSAKSQRSDKV